MVVFCDVTVKVDRRDIAYLHYIMEGYEGLASVSTLDASQGLLRVSADTRQHETLAELLRDLQAEGIIKEASFT